MADAVVPKSITGGCLCGGVRYGVTFAEGHDWVVNPHSCQCTQCRKNSGSLIVHFHSVPATSMQWTTRDTLGEYEHTEGRIRYFCTRCGSFMAWQDQRQKENEEGGGGGKEIEFTVGTVDEVWLVGENEGLAGGYGEALADSKGKQYWSKGMIRGVTDLLPGERV